jgi:hypothetical protein
VVLALNTDNYICCLSFQRSAADQILRDLQNNPDMWLQVVHILQNSQNLNTKFFALQVSLSTLLPVVIHGGGGSLCSKGRMDAMFMPWFDWFKILHAIFTPVLNLKGLLVQSISYLQTHIITLECMADQGQLLFPLLP